MNGTTTVSGLLESLNVTEEELELHKELIEECRENERKIIEYSSLTNQNIEKISVVLSGMYQTMTVLIDALDYLISFPPCNVINMNSGTVWPTFPV